VCAFTVIGERKFLVACVQMRPGRQASDEYSALVESWRRKRSPKDNRPPPIVIAGTVSGDLAFGDLVQEGTGWFDGLTPFVQVNGKSSSDVNAARPRLVFSDGWSCIAGGAEGASRAGEPTLTWVDAASAQAVGTTSATWQTPDLEEP
jgi:hypothetical protein